MFFRFASSAALLAAASMASAPLAAGDFARVSAPSAPGVSSTGDINVQNHRWHRRDRIDGGDVVAGVLVIGAIAAIASAASSNRDRQYRYPQRYPAPNDRYDYRDRPFDPRYERDGGLDRAVDSCAREMERNGRVDTIDGVHRSGEGWAVSGRLATGAPFTCSVGSDGRVEDIDYNGLGASADRQWDDDSYAAARAAHDQAGAPAYPGGPLPGDGVAGDDPDFSPNLDD